MKGLFRSLTMSVALLAGPVVAGVPAVAQAALVRVVVAPPAVRYEVRPAAPSPNHVWTNGYWAWRGGRHVWESGRWVLGRPGYVWVDPHWANEGGQWVFTEGRWVPSGVVGGPVYADTPPPAARVEVIPPEAEWPAGQLWIGGHYAWHGGRHEWIPGRYEARRAGYHWEPYRWEREGGRYRHAGGEWRRD